MTCADAGGGWGVQGGGVERLCWRNPGDTGRFHRPAAAFTGTVGIQADYGRCSVGALWRLLFAGQAGSNDPNRTRRPRAFMLAAMGGYDPKTQATSAEVANVCRFSKRP